ncbi:(2Fe-2S)-binding protein [Acuticoccus kandeliae]|uniref:(2Fe-2S)-binding protein n=1 Tax=Acuticoccus kandeliae TaxID=2073160 RepID=UPI000D3EDDFA|nr:(2Fe-2S)-binding protein [Acuticoccus kandeliae]
MTTTMDITLEINGEDRTLTVEPRTTLVDALREACQLTGTHVDCGEGACGACTILLDGAPVRACLMFAVQASGARITTIEGLADGERLHPLQQALIDHHATGCGYCTPGLLMLAAGALTRDPDMDEDALVRLLGANVCRCTGYHGVVRAMKAAQASMRSKPS